ncbi:AraC family transcriptional regulator [Pedobacter boryungensis]|uniref:AraC family transcriptional regulator n=1 Tax=Pedobacter boryungensis TaxID=869962 RepID=A0ABX2DFA5_9SPHI|nr:helix-turn-helix domain-containing protein [Pedobacter boryungensis]NQX32640.1 AraC family transcriptional regulator [Pedobacter boryungensis]
MKPQLLKVSTDLIHSFSARKDVVADINSHWHYHPEVELIYFAKGSGIQFIGDSIESFNSGDVILVGSNVPHYWRFDSITEDDNNVDVRVIHFNENFWGSEFLDIPENKELKDLLKQSQLGVQIVGTARMEVARLITNVIETNGSRKIINLMEALLSIAATKEVKHLVSMGFKYHFQELEKDRMHSIYNYTISNFKEKIDLKTIAEVAKISPNSFCKYFKSRSKKTYSRFINEIRVSHACKLLMDGKVNVKEVCYDSGFYNFASFHQYFKSITGKSPLQYQKSFLTD